MSTASNFSADERAFLAKLAKAKMPEPPVLAEPKKAPETAKEETEKDEETGEEGGVAPKISAVDKKAKIKAFRKEHENVFARLQDGAKGFRRRQNRAASRGQLLRLKTLMDKGLWKEAEKLIPRANQIAMQAFDDEQNSQECEERYKERPLSEPPARGRRASSTPPAASRSSAAGLSKLEPARKVGDWKLFDKAAKAVDKVLASAAGE